MVEELDFEQALRLVVHAREVGMVHGLTVTVAVHDAAGHPVLVARGSEKWHGPYMAMGKARLAAAFRKPTAVLVENWRDRPMFAQSVGAVLPGEITVNPGGYPLMRGNTCVGAIGVGGGSPDQDDLVAHQAAEWFADPASSASTNSGTTTVSAGR